jgi:multidrug efflux system membrane fusion protein
LLGAFLSIAFLVGACGKAPGDQTATGPAKYLKWATGLFSAKQDESPKGKPKETVPVRIGTVTQQAMPVHLTEVGRVEAYSTISVRPRVAGELMSVAFKEGDVVEKDQVLFTIDPRPYEVALEQARANLAKAEAQADQSRANVTRDKAQAENAKTQLARDTHLLEKGMASPEEVDALKTNAEALNAAVSAGDAAVRSAVETARAAQVAIEDAKLQLEYCTIRSPLKGVTGSLLVNQGNQVRINDANPLVTITQIEPIYVSFALAEKYLGLIRERMAQAPLKVQAIVRGAEDKPIWGELTFIDNLVDETTGTIRLKATFENTDHRLWPGQFVDVVLEVEVLDNAIVAPSQALQNGQNGPYVYVVKPDMTVELRNIVPGEAKGALTVINDGLKPDEKVVTDGQLRLTPGSTISITQDAPSPAAEAKK